MSLIAKARNSGVKRRGRHAIERARPVVQATRLRHAQLVLPHGLHRTRMSETRLVPGSAVVLEARTTPRSPFGGMERIEAVRLPASTG